MVGVSKLFADCATPVWEGMEVLTNSLLVRNSRKHIIELLLSEHNADCTKCYRNGNCELQDLSAEYKITNQHFIDLAHTREYTIDDFSPAIHKDDSRCIRCQRCVRTCDELQSVGALAVINKGDKMKISTFFDKSLNEVVCTSCGQCVIHCPTGALIEHNYIEEVWDAIADPEKYVVVQTAPLLGLDLEKALNLSAGKG